MVIVSDIEKHSINMILNYTVMLSKKHRAIFLSKCTGKGDRYEN